MSKNFNNITRDTYDSISLNWDTKREYVWKPVKEFLEGFDGKKSRDKLKLLDLGCGTGRHLEFARKLGFDDTNLIGCDYSSGQLQVVAKKGFKTVLCDLQSLEFNSDEFDVIVCIAVHHHLLEKDSQLTALKEMRRVLKSGGKLLLSNWFPEKEFLDKQLKKGKFEFLDNYNKKVKVTYTDLEQDKKFDRFYYLFSESELVDLCKMAGFEVVCCEYDSGNLYLTLK